MRLLRWVLLLPGAVICGMLGSLAGGITASVFGQSAVDTTGAFVGTFAFVFATGMIAPARGREVSVGAAALATAVAFVTFALSMFTTVEAFSQLSVRGKVLTPVAQLLGALYALFLLPPLVTARSTLERLWREIVALGTVVATFGAIVVLVGTVIGLLGRGWIGLTVGLGVVLLGSVTWLFPFLHLTLRVSKAQSTIERQIQGPEVGRDISWAEIVRHVFRVVEFDRAGTTIAEDGTIRGASRFEPYGYLLVESPILNERVRLPIVHRDDFWLAASVFDEPKLMEVVATEELLVTYAPKHVLAKGLAGGTSHSLHYLITPRGTLQRYYEFEGDAHIAKPAPEKIFGAFVYEGEIKVQVNPEPLI